jgi:DNA-binding transcriptional LysR family regulator
MKWLTPRLGDFYRHLPELGLKVTGEFSAIDAARMAADGLCAALRFDLGIYPDLASREILDEYLVPVACPGFMAEHTEIVTPSDLRASLLLHDGQPWVGAKAHEEWERWFDGAEVAPPAEGLGEGRQFNMSLLAMEAALSGQGIAMGRLALVLEDLLSGRLCTPFPHFIRSRASYHLVTSGQSPAAMEHVREWLASQAEAFRQRRDRFIRETRISD